MQVFSDAVEKIKVKRSETVKIYFRIFGDFWDFLKNAHMNADSLMAILSRLATSPLWCYDIASFTTHTHTHTQPVNGPLSGTTRVGWHQKKHSLTHTHPDHQTSFINFLHLLRFHISSPNHYLLFATHAHTITTSSAVVARLCHLFLMSISLRYTSTWPFSSLLTLLSLQARSHFHETYCFAHNCCTTFLS